MLSEDESIIEIRLLRIWLAHCPEDSFEDYIAEVKPVWALQWQLA